MRASSGPVAIFGAIFLTPQFVQIGELRGYEIPLAACIAIGIDRLIRMCVGAGAHG